MADTTDVTTQTHWLAIDIAKHWHAVLIETAAGARHRFKMANTAQDYERLIRFIEGLGGRCRAALEPTGDWHRPLAYRLIVARGRSGKCFIRCAVSLRGSKVQFLG